MLTRDKRKPILQHGGLRRLKPHQRTPRYLQVRWQREFGNWIGKRRLRRQLGRFKAEQRAIAASN